MGSRVTERPDLSVQPTAPEVAEFCRRVEEHLTRVNGGQIVRVVGPGFELVRGWALEGIPLSIVLHGVDLKAARHRAGRSKRPLRLEFCEADVQQAYADWRRAVGALPAVEAAATARKRPSLSRHLDRVIDRLGRVTGRLDLAEDFRVRLGAMIQATSALREQARRARGPVRAAVAEKLPALDAALLDAARDAVGAPRLEALRQEASAELERYRTRLAPDAWRRSVDLGTDRLVRDELGLPTLTFDGSLS
jgi:hypothetical protein